MKNVVTNLYPEYLRYIDSFRAIPWKTDALKPVERRLLLTVHETARTKFTKSAKIVGSCIGSYHPHGDQSSYDSLVSLVNRGFVEGQGNWGSNAGLEPQNAAALRYCLVGNTPISTNFGNIEIEKLRLVKDLNLKLNCLSYNQTINNVSEFFDSGVHPTIKIETEYGLTLQGSYNHPIIVLNRNLEFEWKTLEDIKEWDFAVISTNNNICNTSVLNENEALILGCLLSEGWCSNNKIGINNTCTAFIHDYKHAIEKYLNIKNCHVGFSLLPSQKKLYSIEICGHDKIKELNKLGYCGYKSKDIIIPDTIYKSSKKAQSVFLRYLFQGDGSIYIGKKTISLLYSSISEKLILQLQGLLINSFGIFTNIQYLKNSNEIRLLCNDRKSIFKFISEIGFLPGTNKYDISQKIINSKYKKGCKTKYDYIPYLKEFVLRKKIIKSTSQNKLNEKLKTRISYNYKDTLSQNYEFICSLLKKEDIIKINKILTEDYKFLRIIKKENCKAENVFCIRVDSDCHSFVSNGFISHNTEAKANSFLDSLFGEFLNFVDWHEFELDAEPLYLPAPVPIGLVGKGIILGIGNNITKIPRYNFADLAKRTYELITNSPTKTTILPQFDNCSLYEEQPGEFENILTTGKGSIICVPKYKVEGNRLYILGVNPIIGFNKLKNFNISYEEKNNVPFFNLVDLSKTKTVIEITPYRSTLGIDFVKEIIRLISCKIKILCNFVDDDLAVKLFSIDSVLINCFTNWASCYSKSLNYELTTLNKKLFEYKSLQIARDIYINNQNIKTIEEICQIYNTTYTKNPEISSKDLADVSSKYSFKKLVEADLDVTNILTDISNKKNDIGNIQTISESRLKSMF